MKITNAQSVIASLILAATAGAQVRTCGFDSPTYHTGALDSQAGWIVTPAGVPAGVATVVSSPRTGGDQAARFNQAGSFSEFYVDWNPNVALGTAQHGADVEWDMYIEPGDGFGWVVEVKADNNARLGWLWIDNGNMWYSTHGTEPLLANGFMDYHVWHHMKMSMDWSGRRTAFFMDGQQIGSAAWFLSPTRSVGTFELRAIVGGSTDIAGIDTIRVLARPTCPADFNQDGVLSSQDFFDYLNEFFAGRPAADFNADGVVTSQDFFDYMSAFFGGCA
jgi:hypothetical protein